MFIDRVNKVSDGISYSVHMYEPRDLKYISVTAITMRYMTKPFNHTPSYTYGVPQILRL
jgi:hypothetical protein